jgi:hypothetical protein
MGDYRVWCMSHRTMGLAKMTENTVAVNAIPITTMNIALIAIVESPGSTPNDRRVTKKCRRVAKEGGDLHQQNRRHNIIAG